MRKATLLIGIILIAITTMAGGARYQQKMGQTLGQFSSCQSIDDYRSLANQFKVIAKVETEEWLPLYYQAHCYIIMSFMEPSNANKKDEYLELANESINIMLKLAPNEAEVYALQAFYYTAKLVVNPQERGQKYGALTSQTVGRALVMEPNNPRAKYIKLSNEMGTASFFGKDTQPFCDHAKELYTSWDEYKLKSRIHPRWGKEQVQEIVNKCGK